MCSKTQNSNLISPLKGKASWGRDSPSSEIERRSSRRSSSTGRRIFARVCAFGTLLKREPVISPGEIAKFKDLGPRKTTLFSSKVSHAICAPLFDASISRRGQRCEPPRKLRHPRKQEPAIRIPRTPDFRAALSPAPSGHAERTGSAKRAI